ncbi:MAG TPA: amidohydrolase family protein [Xanthobacteraceae bacterium]|nr:amidohydrolase family protein [Xanthobacteraceae bacterium]
MMRVDAYCHFIPNAFFEWTQKNAANFADIGKRMRGIPAIYDLDVRRKMMGQFPDYSQVISYAMPPIENLVQGEQLNELSKLINDGFAEICQKHPDEFPGFVAQVSLDAPDAGVKEAERAIKDLGALGVQIYTNVNGKPLDRPEFADFFKKMNDLGKPVWIHPARGANMPDYLDEKKSLYEIWWTFGWPYETAAAMSRLVFSKTIDNNPDLKLIVHHFGAIVPILEGRIGPGWDQLGSRTSDEDYVSLRKSMKKRPLDYFKQDFYADTATFGSKAAMVCGFEFFPMDKVIFASDCPFDPEKGPGYIRETLRILEELDLSKEDKEKVYYKNLEKLTGAKLVK